MYLRRIIYSAGQKNGFHAFGYNSAESELIWMKFEHCETNIGGWPWRILGTIRAATIWEEAEICFVR